MILSWNPPVDDGGEISGYHIFKGNNTNSLSLIDTVVDESYIDFVESDGIYFYQVIAYNDAGEGEGSEVLSIRIESDDSERMDVTPFIIASIVILLCIILFFVFILKGRNKLYEE